MQMDRKGGDAVTQNLQSHNHMWWVKIGRDTSEARNPSPIPDYPAQGSSARR